MWEFVILESDTAASEVEWFGGFVDDLLANIIIVADAFIGNDKSIGGEF